MPKLTLTLGGKSVDLSNAGDLLKFADPSQGSIAFKIADTALAALADSPLRDVDETELRVGLGVESDSKWKLGAANVTFGLEAATEGALIIRKQGELLRYRLGLDSEKVEIIEVPEGHAYVSVELLVSLGVAGGAKFSHGSLGIDAEASKNLKFVVANHKCVPLDSSVGDAIREVLERFQLPFKPEGVEGLDDGDYLEYEFIGKLSLGFGLSYGVGGLFLGGRSTGEIHRSFESPIGKVVVKARPSFAAKASFSVGYQHEDAFRVVVGRHRRPAEGINTVTLFLFRMDESRLAVQVSGVITLSAGAAVRIDLELEKIIDAAANKLTEGLPAGPVKDLAIKAFKESLKKQENRRQLEKYVQEANTRANKLLKKVNDQKIELMVLHERIKRDTALFNYEFDLNKPAALTDGYPLAVGGQFAKAIKVDGVNLLPGSFVEEEVIRRTSISFQFFDLFRFGSITEYFQKSTIVYAGGGLFQLRFLTGVKHESGRVGHKRQMEVFFTADVLTKDFESVTDLAVSMQFILNDHDNRKGARQTARALEMMARGSALAPLSARLSEAVENDATMHVKVSCVFDKSAYQNLKSDDFVNRKPTPLPHVEDALNWDHFVRAVNFVHAGEGFKGEGFPNLIEAFDQWVLYNRTAIDREGSTKPPDRRQAGNTAVDTRWPSPWIGIGSSDRRFLFIYLDAGRRTMNLFDDLKHLANDLDDVDTEEIYSNLLNDLNEIIKEDVKIWFSKSLLAALFLRSGSRAVDITGPDEREILGDTFEISFRAVA